MKLYMINTREDLNAWLQSQELIWTFGYGGREIIYTPVGPLSIDPSQSNLLTQRMSDPIRVPFHSFTVARCGSESEACIKLALILQEYFAQHPGARTVRCRTAPEIITEPQFDSMRYTYTARCRLVVSKELDDAEAERMKRAS